MEREVAVYHGFMAEGLSGVPFGMILQRYDLLLRHMFRRLKMIDLKLADIPIIHVQYPWK